MVLSAIYIASSWWPPTVQHMIKIITFTKRYRYLQASHRHNHARCKRLRFLLFPLLFFSCAPSVHAIPDTNHLMIKGQASLDTVQQRKYIKAIVDKLNNDHNDEKTTSTSDIPLSSLSSTTPATLQSLYSTPICLQNENFCVVVDIYIVWHTWLTLAQIESLSTTLNISTT